MSLKVIVHSASNLPNVDFRGLSEFKFSRNFGLNSNKNI